MKRKKKKLLKMMVEIENITISLKEIIAAMSLTDRRNIVRSIKKNRSKNFSRSTLGN